MFFLLSDAPHRTDYSQSEGDQQNKILHCTIINFFPKFVCQAHVDFIYLFLSFYKHFNLQLFNFTVSCTLIAFLKGLLFAQLVKVIVLLLATYKTPRMLFRFSTYALINALHASKCNEFSIYSILVLSLELHFVLLLSLENQVGSTYCD